MLGLSSNELSFREELNLYRFNLEKSPSSMGLA